MCFMALADLSTLQFISPTLFFGKLQLYLTNIPDYVTRGTTVIILIKIVAHNMLDRLVFLDTLPRTSSAIVNVIKTFCMTTKHYVHGIPKLYKIAYLTPLCYQNSHNLSLKWASDKPLNFIRRILVKHICWVINDINQVSCCLANGLFEPYLS